MKNEVRYVQTSGNNGKRTVGYFSSGTIINSDLPSEILNGREMQKAREGREKQLTKGGSVVGLLSQKVEINGAE